MEQNILIPFWLGLRAAILLLATTGASTAFANAYSDIVNNSIEPSENDGSFGFDAHQVRCNGNPCISQYELTENFRLQYVQLSVSSDDQLCFGSALFLVNDQARNLRSYDVSEIVVAPHNNDTTTVVFPQPILLHPDDLLDVYAANATCHISATFGGVSGNGLISVPSSPPARP
jgi:hypothetical protein